jgi:two-component system, LytTR family, sensor kinase
LTITYAVLLGALVVTERRRPGFQRTILAVALAAFAVSALHLSRNQGSADQGPWLVELIGHHASLPLVLAILYQDYRFAFTDLFLKRALSLLALVGVVSLLYVAFAAPLVDPHALIARQLAPDGSHLWSTGALLGLWIVTALAYPMIQRRIYRFVDRVVLRRADYRAFRGELAKALGAARHPSEALDATCSQLAGALGAAGATWRPSESSRPAGAAIEVDAGRTGALIVIPTALAPTFQIHVGELSGGRTLLSDDFLLIDTVAALVGRRIDELRIEADRRAREQREQEMRQLAAEAELRALRAQLNPHFLFNALNTLGHLMQTAPNRALETLYQLTNLLRKVLRRTDGGFVALRDELDIVEAYLAIEHERFEERLAVSIDVPRELWHVRVPPLLLQPLVENAVKHGIAPMREGGRVSVAVSRSDGDDADSFLTLIVSDTGAGWTGAIASRNGVGLDNIESRLRHYYGAAAAMAIRPTAGGGTTVELCIPFVPDRAMAVAS